MIWFRRWGRSAWLAPGVLFAVFTLLYSLTLSNHYAPDGLAFASLATRGDLFEPTFFQAEHLLYPASGFVWFKVWGLFGLGEGALLPLQVLNAIFGAAGIALFFLALRLVLGRQNWGINFSLLFAALMGVSYGYWFHSSDAEDLIIANTFTIASFWLLMRLWMMPQRRWQLITPLSATFSLAFLHHGTQVLFLPALLLALWLAQRRWQDLALFSAISLAFVGLPFLLVGTVVKGITSFDGYFSWTTAAPGVGVWGRFELLNIWRGAKTFVNSIIYSGGGPDVRSIGAGDIGFGNMMSLLSFVVIMIVLVITALYLARERRRYHYILLVCVPWALTYAVFALYWAPEDAQFWVGALAPLFILMAIALRGLSGQSGLLRSLIVVGVMLVLAANLATTMLPRRDLSGNVAYAKASCLSEYTEDADLVITPGWGWAGSYMPYFFGSDVFSIVDSYVMAADRDSETLMKLLNSRIKRAQSRGGRVYVARLFTLSDDDLVWFQRATGFSPQDFSLPGKEAFSCVDEPVWELEP